MTAVISTTFRLRRDTAANWASVNPVLKLGEPGLETDTRRVKYGDGSTVWASLGYAAVAWADVTGKPTISSFGASLIDDANAAAARTTLGLDSAATMPGPSGSIVGTTDTQTLTNKTLGATTLPGSGSIDSSGYITGGGSGSWTIGSKSSVFRIDVSGAFFRLISSGNGFAPLQASSLRLTGLPVHADNTAATSGGLAAGDVYRTSTGVLMVRY